MANETDKKEYMKIYGIRIGSVNKDLLEMYRKHIKETSIHRTVRTVVEKRILGYKIKSVDDVNKAIEYSGNLKYNTLCEAVEDIARTEIKDQFRICKNCIYFAEGSGLNGTCTKVSGEYGAYSNACVGADFA